MKNKNNTTTKCDIFNPLLTNARSKEPQPTAITPEGYNPFAPSGSSVGTSTTGYHHQLGEFEIQNTICIKKVIGWYSLHSKNRQYTLSIATHAKPNFIKRFFMRTLLDFYWVKDNGTIQAKSKIEISEVALVFFKILISLYALFGLFILFKKYLTP